MPGECVLPYSGTKNAFLDYENEKLKPWKHYDFSEGVSPWSWSKIGHILVFLF